MMPGKFRFDRRAAVSKIKKMLDARTYRHSLGVEKTARLLAEKYGADPDRAGAAGLLHDCAKGQDRLELLASAGKYGAVIGRQEKDIEALWHGPVGAALVKFIFGIKDKEVLKAIRHHSTGAANPGRLVKILYIADFIEPGRKYSDSVEARYLMKRKISLDQYTVNVIKRKLGYLKSNGMKIHSSTEKMLGNINIKAKKS